MDARMDIGTESAIAVELTRNLKRQYEEKMYKIRIELEKEHKEEMAKQHQEHLAARKSMRVGHERAINQMWQNWQREQSAARDRINQLQGEIASCRAIIANMRNGSTGGEAMPNGRHPETVQMTTERRTSEQKQQETSPSPAPDVQPPFNFDLPVTEEELWNSFDPKEDLFECSVSPIKNPEAVVAVSGARSHRLSVEMLAAHNHIMESSAPRSATFQRVEIRSRKELVAVSSAAAAVHVHRTKEAAVKVKTAIRTRIRIGTGATKYICPEASCGESFVTVDQIKRHMRIHIAESPITCLCSKVFSHSNGYRQHRKVCTAKA